MKYLKRDGSVHDSLPQLDEYVEDDQEAVVEAVFSVQLLDENLNVVGVETLHSTNYPKETTIKWCLLRTEAVGQCTHLSGSCTSSSIEEDETWKRRSSP